MSGLITEIKTKSDLNGQFFIDVAKGVDQANEDIGALSVQQISDEEDITALQNYLIDVNARLTALETKTIVEVLPDSTDLVLTNPNVTLATPPTGYKNFLYSDSASGFCRFNVWLEVSDTVTGVQIGTISERFRPLATVSIFGANLNSDGSACSIAITSTGEIWASNLKALASNQYVTIYINNLPIDINA